MPGLAARWRRAIPGSDPMAADRAAVELLGRWSQPHRHYHGLAHLVAVLTTVDEHARWAADPDAVRLAVWFHDAVYDPRRHDNEEASAALAGAMLPGLGVPADRVAEVCRLVRLTVRHRPAPGDRNGELLCDADLAILAAPPTDYRQYAQRIRREYAHVPEQAFRAGRVAILRHLLGLPALYRVPQLHNRWEARARENIQRELTALT